MFLSELMKRLESVDMNGAEAKKSLTSLFNEIMEKITKQLGEMPVEEQPEPGSSSCLYIRLFTVLFAQSE